MVHAIDVLVVAVVVVAGAAGVTNVVADGESVGTVVLLMESVAVVAVPLDDAEFAADVDAPLVEAGVGAAAVVAAALVLVVVMETVVAVAVVCQGNKVYCKGVQSLHPETADNG